MLPYSALKFRHASLALVLGASAFAQVDPNRPLTYQQIAGWSGKPWEINLVNRTPKSIPDDAATRYAGMPARVGTWLAADRPIWWNFDAWSRAEALDAYWNIVYNTLGKEPMAWTGSANTVTGVYVPGETSQGWRNSQLRVLNYARYLHHGAAVGYLVEDKANIPAVQAAALLQAVNFPFRNFGLTHTPDPSYLAYSALAYTGSFTSNLTGGVEEETSLYYIGDAGFENRNLGHRMSMLGAFATTATFGDVDLRVSFGQANATRIDEISLSNRIATTAKPMDALRMWPHPGYIPREILLAGGNPLRISITSSAAGLNIDPASARITVRRNGVPMPVSGQRTNGRGLVFDLTLDDRDRLENGRAQINTVPPADAAFDVTVENIVWTRSGVTGAGTPPPEAKPSTTASSLSARAWLWPIPHTAPRRPS